MWRTFRTLLLASMLVVSGADRCPAQDADREPGAHLHGQTEHIRRLLRSGYTQSWTVRRLIDRLDRANVYVSIVEGHCRPWDHHELAGCTAYLGAPGEFQHIRVIVNLDRADDTQMSLVGHELQHACEIVEGGPITVAAYAKSLQPGRATGGRLVYETDQAQAAEQAVLRELRVYRRMTALSAR